MLPNNFINIDSLKMLDEALGVKSNQPVTIKHLQNQIREVADLVLVLYKSNHELSCRVHELEKKLKPQE